MRQTTIIKTYLKFNELDENQKEKVLEKLYDLNVSDEYWYECPKDDFEAKLKKLGFYKIETQFSGFSSQGDGACFSAKHPRGDITTSGRYSHSGSMNCDNNALLAVAKRLANKYYSQLSENYDYLTSREVIIEMIEANEYEFDQDTLKIGIIT